jgi:hypothetical protein
MRLRIKHPLIQAPPILTLKQQPRILQRLRQPKTLHLILDDRAATRDVVDGAVAVSGAGSVQDGRDHFPARAAPVGVAGYTVHVEDGFEGFRARKRGC